MSDFLLKGFARVLSWMFVVGVAGSVFLVIPVAAYQLFSVLFERDRPEEINPSEFPARVSKI